MSTTTLVNTCPACGAEESLDALLLRMIEDDQVRRLIADVLTRSLPLGGLVVRYLRLHKPPKQKLRMQRVAAVLGELVPDVARGAITRKGRDWQLTTDTWRLALEAVFTAVDKGTLIVPLDGNVYLYEVLMRMADRSEGAAERDTEAARRSVAASRPYDPTPIATALHTGDAPKPPPPQPPTGPSRYALRLQAQIKAAQAAKGRTDSPEDERTEP